MSLLQLISNPARRRGRSKKRSGAKRRSTTHLRKFQFKSNPRRRRQLGFVSAPSRRRLASVRSGIALNAKSIGNALMNGAIAGAGAIAVDLAMGQANKILPLSATSRFTADGKINVSYYGAKGAIALAAGLAGQAFLPSGMKRYAITAAEGALAVMSYEIMKTAIPSEWALGYFNPAPVLDAKVTQLNAYQSTRRAPAGLRGMAGMNAYVRTQSRRLGGATDGRIGETEIV